MRDRRWDEMRDDDQCDQELTERKAKKRHSQYQDVFC